MNKNANSADVRRLTKARRRAGKSLIHIILYMVFFQADEKGLDLLDKLLSFDPIRRVDVEGSLAHAYLSPYYDPADEPLAEKPFTYDMEFDELPIKELREMVYKEAVDFKMAKLTETPL